MSWYLRDANTWARDNSRYGARHRWQRRKAIANLNPWQKCRRCGQQLIPEDFADPDKPGWYKIPYGWISKNIHLDHADGSDTQYNGLVHAKCNLTAPKKKASHGVVPR